MGFGKNNIFSFIDLIHRRQVHNWKRVGLKDHGEIKKSQPVLSSVETPPQSTEP
jgi:hypothetical protein